MPWLLKGQAWMVDVFFALLIFIAVLTIFFKSSLNYSDSDAQEFDDIMFEAKLVSDSLLTPGTPTGWDSSSVIEIGLTEDYRINDTKLSFLASMAYQGTKTLLRTKYDYYIFFRGRNSTIRFNSTQEGIGSPGVNSTYYGSPSDLVIMTRYVIFRNEPARMVVYLWN